MPVQMPNILDKLLGKGRNKGLPDYKQFETVSERSPMVVEWQKDIYEQHLVRSVIERIALACQKLEPVAHGTAKPRVRRAIETAPNKYQSWPQFLHRCATLYFNDNDLYIVPTFKEGTDIVTGFYPIRSTLTQIVYYGGEEWVRFSTPAGRPLAVELSNVAILTRFQYKSDFFGTPNNLNDTLALLSAQAQAQKQAIKDTGAVRWMGKLSGQVREDDIKNKRERFYEDNLDPGNNKTGLMVYDGTYADMKQIDPKNWTIPTSEMERIENEVFDYFGINRSILQNSYDENAWDAFYEGVIEPWAILLGEALSQMVYTMRERPANRIEFSSDRLAYASAATKRNMNKDMLDRGVLTINQALKLLQLPEVEGGDVRILRGEYKAGRTFDEILRTQRAQVAAQAAGDSDEGDADPQDKIVERPDADGHAGAGDTDTGDASTSKQDRWED